MKNEIDFKQTKTQFKRLPYQTPNLMQLGRVSALVQAGSMFQPEGMPGQGDMEKL